MGTDGAVYWKSLEELRAECHDASARAHEFIEPLPWKAGQRPAARVDTTRRDFLGLMGFTLAAAACSRAPTQHAIPFVNAPEELTPGVANWYATTCCGCSAACSLIVKTRDGRPIKVEGNPDSSLFGGGTCAVGQATVLSLYDGERLRQPLWQGQPVSWADIDENIGERLEAAMAGGRRVVLLSGTISSPSTRDLIRGWSSQYPGFQHIVYEPVSCAAIRQAYRNGLGRAIVPHYRFDRAALIVGLEADFLGTWLSPVEFTSQYARRRQPGPAMPRHVQFESGLSVTGANADVRYAVRPSEVGRVALALLDRVRAESLPGIDDADLPVDASVVDGLANELRRHQGESLIVCGVQDVAVQTVVAGLNHLLGNIGSTIELDRPSLQRQADDGEMAKLVADMQRGEVHALFVYGVNPAYDYPDATAFLEGLERVALSVSFADRLDETASRVHAVCPDHHYLEAWGDAEPVTGYYSLAQPTVAPLFDTRAAQDSLLKWLGRVPDFYAYLRTYWQTTIYPRQDGEPDFDRFWDRTLQAGVLDVPPEAGDAPRFQADLDAAARRVRAAHRQAQADRTAEHQEAHLYETVAQRDGRHANNPWLQELPDPITKLTWGHALALPPAAATRLGVRDGDVVAVSGGAIRVELPVCIQPGQAPGTVSIALGYGRTRSGKVGTHIGINAFPLMQRAQEDGIVRAFATGVTLQKTGRHEALAATQSHHSMEGRPLVRETTLRDFLQGSPAEHEAGGLPTLWSEHPVGAAHVGNGHRPGRMHRVLGVRRGVPGGEQRSGRREGRSSARPGDALDPHRPLLQRLRDRPRYRLSAGDVPALRQRAVRDRLPGSGHRAQLRWHQPAGVQPVHRHAVLREQLPVQGPPLQLVQVREQSPVRLQHEQPARDDGAQPGRGGALARSHGEVQPLHPANPGRQGGRRARGKGAPRR